MSRLLNFMNEYRHCKIYKLHSLLLKESSASSILCTYVQVLAFRVLLRGS